MIRFCPDYPAACIAINELVAARYPDDRDVLESLTVKVMPCPHQGSNRMGRVIIAWPTQEGAKGDNLLVAYFGDEPA